MFTQAHIASVLTPDFSQHGNTRADSQYMENWRYLLEKVTPIFPSKLQSNALLY